MVMPAQSGRILMQLEQLGTECPLEEVVDLCPDVTWNQVFLAIDHLSRTGHVRVRLDPSKTYWVQSNQCEATDRPSNPPGGSRAFEHQLNGS
jgi:hypothetical protein